MSEDGLATIEARANAATLGPWVHETSYGAIGAVEAGNEALAQVQQRVARDNNRRDTDAAFIAHARTDIPALIAEVRRLRKDAALLDWLQSEHDRYDPAALLTVKRNYSREGNVWANVTGDVREEIAKAMEVTAARDYFLSWVPSKPDQSATPTQP